MKQLSFVLEDIKRSKLYYLRFVIQITAVLLIIALCVSLIFSLKAFLDRFSIFDDLSKVYLSRDLTSDEVYSERMEDPDTADKLQELNDFISGLEGVRFCSYSPYSIYLPVDLPPLRISNGLGYHDSPKNQFPLLQVSRGFIDVFSLDVSSGRSLDSMDFEAADDMNAPTPILLGSVFAPYYKPGDIIDGKYEVIGILSDNAFFLDPGRSGTVNYLKHHVISPVVLNKNTDAVVLYSMISFGHYYVNDPALLSKIEDKAKALGVMDDMEFISYNEQLKNIVADSMKLVYIGFAGAAVILLFCVSCCITSMLNYIDAHRHELAVHMLVGAKMRDIITRLAIPTAAALLIANLIVILILRNPEASAVVFVFSIILLSAIMLLPAMRIISRPLSDALNER